MQFCIEYTQSYVQRFNPLELNILAELFIIENKNSLQISGGLIL